MIVFITGASGFVGTNLINKLLIDKHTVYALTRRRKNLKKKGLVWVNGSLTSSLKEISLCNTLIHLIAAGVNNKKLLIGGIQIKIKKLSKNFQMNFLATQAILKRDYLSI